MLNFSTRTNQKDFTYRWAFLETLRLAVPSSHLVDWPDWRGRSNKSDPSGIKMLSFSIDKDSYEPGETVIS